MNEKTIWDSLMSKVHNPYGVAAIMGNLMAESSLNPANATGRNKTENYVSDADNGRIDFAYDGVAFGLVQWCYWSRKQGLLDFAKSRRKSVGDIHIQLDYMWEELQKYKTVLNAILNAENIRAASDTFMLKYEKPAGTGMAARKKRADYGQKFFSMFAARPSESLGGGSASASQEASGTAANLVSHADSGNVPGKKVVITAPNVNVRVGNGKGYHIVCRANTGDVLPWVATAPNGWHAVQKGAGVFWVSGEFSVLTD